MNETDVYKEEQLIAAILMSNNSQLASGKQAIKDAFNYQLGAEDLQFGQGISYRNKFGRHHVVLVPQGGDEAIFVSGPPAVETLEHERDGLSESSPSVDIEHELQIVGDSLFDIDVRASALWKVIHEDPDSGRQFVLDTFAVAGKEKEDSIRCSLAVFAAEKLRFEQNSDQEIVWNGLLDFVKKYSASETLGGVTAAVHAALRRLGTLIPPSEVESLIPLLNGNGGMEIRVDCLDAILTVFSLGPAESRPSDLIARVDDLSHKLLDSDLLVPGPTSLLAEKTIVVLACLDRKLLLKAIDTVKAVNFPWFTRVVLKGVRNQISNWKSSTEEYAEVESAIDELAR